MAFGRCSICFSRKYTMRFLEGEKCYLRALEPSDIDFLYDLENDETLWEISQTQKPFSRAILQEYLQNATQSIYQSQQLRLAIVSKMEMALVGCVDLYEFDPKNKRAGIGIVLLPEYRKKGLASEALILLIRYAFHYLDLHQLFAEISQDNLPSIQLFKKVGFSYVGTKKDWIYSKGEYKDVGIYQIFNKNDNITDNF